MTLSARPFAALASMTAVAADNGVTHITDPDTGEVTTMIPSAPEENDQSLEALQAELAQLEAIEAQQKLDAQKANLAQLVAAKRAGLSAPAATTPKVAPTAAPSQPSTFRYLTSEEIARLAPGQMMQYMTQLQAENERLKAKKARSINIKVSPKGAVTLTGGNIRKYGMTFYAEEWETVFAQVEQVKAFINVNRHLLSKKGDNE